MPSATAYTISEGPDRIGVECSVCGRSGSYAKARLLERFGDIDLPSLVDRIVDCRWRKDTTHMGGCGARLSREVSAHLRRMAGLKELGRPVCNQDAPTDYDQLAPE